PAGVRRALYARRTSGADRFVMPRIPCPKEKGGGRAPPPLRGSSVEKKLAAETDGDFEVRPVDGAVVILVRAIAAINRVVIALPAIAGAKTETVDGVGKAQANIDNRHGNRLRTVNGDRRFLDVGQDHRHHAARRVLPAPIAGLFLPFDRGLLFS